VSVPEFVEERLAVHTATVGQRGLVGVGSVDPANGL